MRTSCVPHRKFNNFVKPERGECYRYIILITLNTFDHKNIINNLFFSFLSYITRYETRKII